MSPLAKLGFLILEDNPNMVTIVRTVLKGFGATNVYDADTVVDAFELGRRHRIDIALVDCQLRAGSGLDYVRLIRSAADSPDPYMPIIMLSGYSEQSRVRAARDVGATEFLAKPITALDVFRKIMDVVDRPRPFIRSAGFFGPDRRRHDDVAYDGPERRALSPSGRVLLPIAAAE